MTPEAPHQAAALLAFIRRAETGEDDNEAYRTIIGHHQGELPKPLTRYTVDELLKAQLQWGRKWGSSAAGAYQIIRKTLLGLKAGLGLTGSEIFDASLQDRLGYELLCQRGIEKAMDGRLAVSAFALALAKEWASMPVLLAVKGASRQIRRGQSYYAGDGLNKAQVTPEALEAVLAQTFRSTAAPAKPPLVGREQIDQVQAQLRALGYSEVGAVDGIAGPATENAILIFRKDNGLPLSTRIDDPLLAALMKAKPRVVSPARADAPAAVVREQAPEARKSWLAKVWSNIAAAFSAVTAGVGWLVANLGEARAAVKPITDVLGQVPIWAWLGLLALGFVGISRLARGSEKAAVNAYRTGERR